MTANGAATYSYDAENRMVANPGATYVYDGDGNRVKKVGSATTLYWYGATDDILTETDASGGTVTDYAFFNGKRIARRDPSGSVHYYFSDHLGSHSLITDQNGDMPAQYEADFFPYGGEIPITTGDTNHYKFTGKERDAETCGTMCLDNFGARYDSSSLGRFMTPDWDVKPVTVPYAKFGDPQTLNLYAYVENGPINAADADGHAPWGMAGGADCTGNEDQCQKNRQKAASDAWNAGAAKLVNAALARSEAGLHKFLSYFYYKGANTGPGGAGFGISDIKVGPIQIDAVVQKGTKQVQQTVEGKTVSTIDEMGIKAGVGPVKLGLDRTTTQEEGKTPVTETTIRW